MAEHIDLNHSEQYTLSIRLSTDGFSFSIYNPFDEGSCFYHKPFSVNPQRSLSANIKTFLAEQDEFKHSYRQTNIVIDTNRFTAVPLDLYEDEQTERIFYQNLPKQSNELILCNVLGKNNMAILFSIDKLSHQLLTDQFPQARFYASVSPLAEYFYSKSKIGNNKKIFVNLHDSHMEIIAFQRGRLLFLNTFSCAQPADKIYYLLKVWEQLAYSQEHDELQLAGSKSTYQPILETLKNYIRQVFIINPQAEYHLSGNTPIEEIPFDIQTLLTCE